jgi:hypothetical protein
MYNVKLSIASAGSLRRRPRLFWPAISGSYATIDCIFCLFVPLSQLQQRLHVVYFVGGLNRLIRAFASREPPMGISGVATQVARAVQTNGTQQP